MELPQHEEYGLSLTFFQQRANFVAPSYFYIGAARLKAVSGIALSDSSAVSRKSWLGKTLKEYQ